jgi:LPXTG-motif cell wall-anchored protein
MKSYLAVSSLVLAMMPVVAGAQQPAVCERVEFSQDVLARFPNIRQACLDVIQKDGQEFAVVKADLIRATARRMTVRVKLPDGTRSEPRAINVAPGFRVNVNGRSTRIEEIAVGQEITAYVNVRDPGIALAPAEPTEPVVFTPVPAEPEPEPAAVATAEPEMPKTATQLPLLGALGVALLALGAGFAFLRRRGTHNS